MTGAKHQQSSGCKSDASCRGLATRCRKTFILAIFFCLLVGDPLATIRGSVYGVSEYWGRCGHCDQRHPPQHLPQGGTSSGVNHHHRCGDGEGDPPQENHEESVRRRKSDTRPIVCVFKGSTFLFCCCACL